MVEPDDETIVIDRRCFFEALQAANRNIYAVEGVVSSRPSEVIMWEELKKRAALLQKAKDARLK